MSALLTSSLTRGLLLLWLVVTNLSMGLFHHHEGATPPDARADDAPASYAWHYHLALFGLELDALTVYDDRCPFESCPPDAGETQLLLAAPFGGAAPERDAELPAVDLGHALAVLCELAPAAAAEGIALGECAAPPPPCPSALGTRSGVQQL